MKHTLKQCKGKHCRCMQIYPCSNYHFADCELCKSGGDKVVANKTPIEEIVEETIEKIADQFDGDNLQYNAGKIRGYLNELLTTHHHEELQRVRVIERERLARELDWRKWGLGNTPHSSEIIDGYEKRIAMLLFSPTNQQES